MILIFDRSFCASENNLLIRRMILQNGIVTAAWKNHMTTKDRMILNQVLVTLGIAWAEDQGGKAIMTSTCIVLIAMLMKDMRKAPTHLFLEKTRDKFIWRGQVQAKMIWLEALTAILMGGTNITLKSQKNTMRERDTVAVTRVWVITHHKRMTKERTNLMPEVLRKNIIAFQSLVMNQTHLMSEGGTIKKGMQAMILDIPGKVQSIPEMSNMMKSDISSVAPIKTPEMNIGTISGGPIETSPGHGF